MIEKVVIISSRQAHRLKKEGRNADPSISSEYSERMGRKNSTSTPVEAIKDDLLRGRLEKLERIVSTEESSRVMAVDTNPNLNLDGDTNQPQNVGAGDSNVQRL